MQGNAEKEIAPVLENKRKYEYLHAKLDAIESMGENANLKIFGNSEDNMLSQMAAFNMVAAGKQGGIQGML